MKLTILLLSVGLCGCGEYFSFGGGTDGADGGTDEGTDDGTDAKTGDVCIDNISAAHGSSLVETGAAGLLPRQTWHGAPGNWLNAHLGPNGIFDSFIWANNNYDHPIVNLVDGSLVIGESSGSGETVWVHMNGPGTVTYGSIIGLFGEFDLSNIPQPDGSVIAWGVKPQGANSANVYYKVTTAVRGAGAPFTTTSAGPSLSNMRRAHPAGQHAIAWQPSIGECTEMAPPAADSGSGGEPEPEPEPDENDTPLCWTLGGAPCATLDSWTVETIHGTLSGPLTPVGSGAWANRTTYWDPEASVSGGWHFDEPDVDGPAFVQPQQGAQLSGVEWWPGEIDLVESEGVLSSAWLLGKQDCTISLTFQHGPESDVADAVEIPLAGEWGGMSGYVAPLGHFGDLADTLDHMHMEITWDVGDCELAGWQTGPNDGKFLPKVGGETVTYVQQYWVPYGGVVSFDAV